MNWTMTPEQVKRLLDANELYESNLDAYEWYNQYANFEDDNIQGFAEYHEMTLTGNFDATYNYILKVNENEIYEGLGFETESDAKASATIVLFKEVQQRVNKEIEIISKSLLKLEIDKICLN